MHILIRTSTYINEFWFSIFLKAESRKERVHCVVLGIEQRLPFAAESVFPKTKFGPNLSSIIKLFEEKQAACKWGIAVRGKKSNGTFKFNQNNSDHVFPSYRVPEKRSYLTRNNYTRRMRGGAWHLARAAGPDLPAPSRRAFDSSPSERTDPFRRGHSSRAGGTSMRKIRWNKTNFAGQTGPLRRRAWKEKNKDDK